MPPQDNSIIDEPQSQGVFSDILDGKYVSDDVLHTVYGTVGMVHPAGSLVDGIAHVVQGAGLVFGGAAEFAFSDREDALEVFEQRLKDGGDHLKNAAKDAFWCIPGLKILGRLRKAAKLLKGLIKAEKLLKAGKYFEKAKGGADKVNTFRKKVIYCLDKEFAGFGKEVLDGFGKSSFKSIQETLSNWKKAQKVNYTEAGEMLNLVLSWADAVKGSLEAVGRLTDDIDKVLETQADKEFRETLEMAEKMAKEIERWEKEQTWVEEEWDEPTAKKKRDECRAKIKKDEEEIGKYAEIEARSSQQYNKAETDETTFKNKANSCQNGVLAYESGLEGARSRGDKDLERILKDNRKKALLECYDWSEKADKAGQDKDDAEARYMEAAVQKAWLQYDRAQQEANIAKNTKPDRFALQKDHGYKGLQEYANEKCKKYDEIKKKVEDMKKKHAANRAARAAKKVNRDAERKKLGK